MHKDKNKYIDKLSSQLSTFNDLYTIVILALSPHDDVIKWKPFPRYWLFVRGIHRSPVNSPHKSQWRGALMFSLMCIWINDWVNTREAGDLRRYRGRYDVTVMDGVWRVGASNQQASFMDLAPIAALPSHTTSILESSSLSEMRDPVSI